jgi:hypothetical protein
MQPLRRIPYGYYVSMPISSRWIYESFVNISGLGDEIIKDACWTQPLELRQKMTATDKENCYCMGPNIFKNCAAFPGILSPDFYTENAKAALAMAEPVKPLEPTRIPSPTPLPSPTMLPTPAMAATPSPYPTPAPLPIGLWFDPHEKAAEMTALPPSAVVATMSVESMNYAYGYKSRTMKMIDDYRIKREGQFVPYQQEMVARYDQYKEAVKGQINDYITAQSQVMADYSQQVQEQYNGYFKDVEHYGNVMTDWEKNRQQAIGSAETIMGMVYDDFGQAFFSTPYVRWGFIGIISLVELIICVIFQKRKDSV